MKGTLQYGLVLSGHFEIETYNREMSMFYSLDRGLNKKLKKVDVVLDACQVVPASDIPCRHLFIVNTCKTVTIDCLSETR